MTLFFMNLIVCFGITSLLTMTAIWLWSELH
ncbi:Uncharacterised protein [Neisseria weaveri]|uniref:Uncharacterized protein n=1 Tax=Neisseria weaveri TaxID=28091 RepID=A0A3S5C3S2_9NEIS|nr:Uncharacterised protein [Neisseria weaveri]VEJ50691.1 Uncharacterised protein [Neisseria weaveri]